MRGARRRTGVIIAAMSMGSSAFTAWSLNAPAPAWAAAAPTDVISTVAGGGAAASANGASATTEKLGQPLAAVVDDSGNIVVADQNDNVVRVVAQSSGTFYGRAMTRGDVYTVAGTGAANYTGDGGPATSASLWGPNGVVVDASGDVVITDTGNNEVRFVPRTTGVYFGLFMTAGDIYDIAGNAQASGYAGDGGQATAALLSSPDGLTFDRQGNLLVADTGNDVIRLVGNHLGTDFGLSVTPGDIYTVAGNGNFGYSGDHGPAGAATLNLSSFSGLAVDARGDLLLADGGNNVVRLVAATTGSYGSMPVMAGDIYTIVGTGVAGYRGNRHAALSAQLDTPQGVAVDAAGDILVADSNNNVIRLVAAASGRAFGLPVRAGDIYTVAGNSIAGYTGDGRRPTTAELNSPSAVAVSPSGEMVVVDNGNDVLRLLAPPPPAVSTLSPPSGPTAGGTKVTIAGRNLSGAVSVLFGAKPALSFSVVSAHKVVASSPPASAGAVSVTVSTASGLSAPGAGATFTYLG